MENAVNAIVAWQDRVMVLIEKVTEISVKHEDHFAKMEQNLAEYRRDAEQYRRWWTYLAQKHGWLDYEDWPLSPHSARLDPRNRPSWAKPCDYAKGDGVGTQITVSLGCSTDIGAVCGRPLVSQFSQRVR